MEALLFLLYYLHLDIFHYRQEKLTTVLFHVPALPHNEGLQAPGLTNPTL